MRCGLRSRLLERVHSALSTAVACRSQRAWSQLFSWREQQTSALNMNSGSHPWVGLIALQECWRCNKEFKT